MAEEAQRQHLLECTGAGCTCISGRGDVKKEEQLEHRREGIPLFLIWRENICKHGESPPSCLWGWGFARSESHAPLCGMRQSDMKPFH